ncbi:sigma-70 family RNA polymerase sigma factor [Cellulosimicrobium terreum]|nr:sigma-70 family RNA polymerase sigma factor [Cellulosimicrobium terreum]
MTDLQLTPWSPASSDAELISAVRAGDTTAYGALYERHASAALTVARQYVRSSADADDVVADAFARTLGVLQKGGGPDVTFRAYVFTVVRRLSYDLVNGARRTQPTDDERTFENAFGPLASTEDPALEGFERSIVSRAYQTLPERWRAVLWYTEVENLPPADIAPILGLTANGVAALSYRAREGLRQAYLQQHLNGQPAEECRGVNGLLGSYVRGGLAKRETARVESHLDECMDCRGLVLELGDVSHGMRSVIAPLVLGVGALGLVGTALPVAGGSAVAGAGAGSAGGTGAGGGAAGGTGGSAGGAAGGGAATGSAATGTAGATGATASGAAGGTTAGGATAGAGVGGASAGAGGAATAAGAGATAVAGAGAASGGGLAVAAGGGLVALVSAAPVASAAVALGVLAVTGLGVAGALGAFTPGDTPPPAAVAPTPTPTDGATTAPVDPTAQPTEPSEDPTSPTNIPPDPSTDPATGGGTVVDQAPTTPAPGTGTGALPPTTDPLVPTDPLTPISPVTPTPAPTDPTTPTPTPTDPPAPPEPAPAALDLTLGTVELEARVASALPVTASNTGGRPADDVVVDITLPPGVSTEEPAQARGAAVVPVLTAESIPCGTATPGTDGTSVVQCAIGTLAAGATEDVVVKVWAEDGGDYEFSGRVSALGLEPVSKKFKPRSVSYFGPQVRVMASGIPVSVANPGVTTVDLVVRNNGDRGAVDPAVSLVVPSGLSLVTGAGGTQDVAGWTCAVADGPDVTCSSPSGTTLAAKSTVTLPVRVLADDAGAHDAGQRTVKARGTAFDGTGKPAKEGGTRDVQVDVGGYWAGAEEGLAEPVEPQCTAAGNADTASLVVEEFTNLTAYDDLDVTLTAVGSSATRSLGAGEAAELAIDDGVRFPAGAATIDLSTTIAGTTFTHQVEAGSFAATDCWSVPPWLTSADVTTENVDGTVRYTARVRNVTGKPMDVRLLAPDRGAWDDVADSAAVAPLRSDTDADLVLDTGRASMPAGTATLRQYRFHSDTDGDGKGYQSLLDVELPAETIAPAAPEPTVGACVFDPSDDTSSATVTLLLDNTASTLPVTFAVPGVQEPVQVASGATRTVTTTVGADAAELEVRADGSVLETYTVPGVDCFDWSEITGAASATAAWVVGKGGSTGSTVLTGTFRNDYAATTLRVSMSAGDHGATDAVDVGPGDEETFTLDVRARDVAAGTATFTAERSTSAGAESRTTEASYDASTYVPQWATSATVDAVWQDGSVKLVGTFTNDSPETVDARMLGGTFGDAAPVQKIAPGKSATFTIDTRSLDVKAGSVSFRQYRWVLDKGFADAALRASHDGAAYVPQWATSATVDAVWQDGSVKLVGTFTNDSPETVDARMLGGTYGDAAPVQKIAPGASATFTIDTRSLDVKAGSVSFRQYRSVLGKGFADTALRATHRGAAYVPDWSATATAEATCTGDLADAVTLTTTLRNDSAEPMRAVVSSPLGTKDLGVVAPGETGTFAVGSGKIALDAGSATFTLSREVLGRTFTHEVTAGYAALDCTRLAPAADVVLGDAYYDDARDHSYRAVSVVLDNTGSNVPVTFSVAGASKGSWKLAAGESRTESLGEASWSGASYTVTAGGWSRTLGVDGFTAAPQCYDAWQHSTWYDHSDSVSYKGWNYAARNSGFLVRPDGVLGRLFWQVESRCGEG